MTKINEQQYDRIVATIYEAGLDPAKWQNFVNELGAVFDGVRFAFQGHDLGANETEVGALVNYDESYIQTYLEYYAAINPWFDWLSTLPIGRPTDSEVLPERQVWERSEFYNDWIKPQEDISNGIGLVLFREDNRSLVLSTNIRKVDAEILKPKVQRALERLAPHLQRAFNMHRTLEGNRIAERTYLTAIDQISNAVFLLDEQGKLLYQNTRGEVLLREAAVFHINNGDRLHVVDGNADQVLSQSLKAIVTRNYADDMPATITLRSSTRVDPYIATLVPFRPDHDATFILSDFVESQYPVALLTIIDPAKTRRPPRRMLKSMFELTSAEANLTVSLSQGKTLQSFSDDRQVSIHTARNQLKSVFLKTGTHKQSDLVALVGRLTA